MPTVCILNCSSKTNYMSPEITLVYSPPGNPEGPSYGSTRLGTNDVFIPIFNVGMDPWINALHIR